MRKSRERLSHFNAEGVVLDIDSCKALCERIGNSCIGYELSNLSGECYTFEEELGSMSGDGSD